MTHKEREARRRKMAKELRSGTDPRVLARRYKCSLGMVMDVARTHGIKVPRSGGYIGVQTLDVVAALQERPAGWVMADVARELDVSRQWVNQVYKAACKAGVKLPCWQVAGKTKQVA